jgi:hypothetical protein
MGWYQSIGQHDIITLKVFMRWYPFIGIYNVMTQKVTIWISLFCFGLYANYVSYFLAITKIVLNGSCCRERANASEEHRVSTSHPDDGSSILHVVSWFTNSMCNLALLKNPKIALLSKKSIALNGDRVLTRTRHWFLSWARWMQPITHPSISLRYICLLICCQKT